MANVFFMSVTSDPDTISKDPDHVSTDAAFTAATVDPQPSDIVALRMGNATFVPTQRQVLVCLERMERWIIQNGLDGLGANLSPNRG